MILFDGAKIKEKGQSAKFIQRTGHFVLQKPICIIGISCYVIVPDIAGVSCL